MVFKIIGEFSDKEFERIMAGLSYKKYKILYIEDTFYVSAVQPTDASSMLSELKNIFTPNDSFLITLITKENIKKLSYFVQEWCSENYIRLDTLKFEAEQQEYLRKINKAIDDSVVDFKKEIERNNAQKGEVNTDSEK